MNSLLLLNYLSFEHHCLFKQYTPVAVNIFIKVTNRFFSVCHLVYEIDFLINYASLSRAASELVPMTNLYQVNSYPRQLVPYRGCVAQLAERWSLAGELTLSCPRPAADG